MRNRSTSDQVAYFNQAIKDVLDDREVLRAAFVDFKTAYDSVWRKLLINKFSFMGDLKMGCPSFLISRLVFTRVLLPIAFFSTST